MLTWPCHVAELGVMAVPVVVAKVGVSNLVTCGTADSSTGSEQCNSVAVQAPRLV
jgi:hypothetical protein